MKSLVTLAAVTAFVLTGCVPKDPAGSAEEAVDALPTSDTLNVAVPGAAGKLGDVAASYLITRTVAAVLNGEAALVLGLAKTITTYPVTSIENDTLIWGPWSEALKPGEYRMTAKLTNEGKWAWTIEGRAKGSSGDFQAIVTGLATPGRPHRGSGNFTFDCDVAHALDPFGGCDDGGQASVTYDLEHVPATVTVDAEHLAPMPDGSQAEQTFHYQYSVNADGSGELSFMQFGDTDDPGTAWETTTYDSKWLATGAGRTDISVTGGDVGSAVVTATECWDVSFEQTYFTVSAGWLPTVGTPAGCSL